MNNKWERAKAIREAIREQYPNYETMFSDVVFEPQGRNWYSAQVEHVVMWAHYVDGAWKLDVYDGT